MATELNRLFRSSLFLNKMDKGTHTEEPAPPEKPLPPPALSPAEIPQPSWGSHESFGLENGKQEAATAESPSPESAENTEANSKNESESSAKLVNRTSASTQKKKRILISEVRVTRSPIANSVLPPAHIWMFI